MDASHMSDVGVYNKPYRYFEIVCSAKYLFNASTVTSNTGNTHRIKVWHPGLWKSKERNTIQTHCTLGKCDIV